MTEAFALIAILVIATLCAALLLAVVVGGTR